MYMTTSGACVLKAGTNVSTAFTGASAQANWETLVHEAESHLHVVTRWNISGAFANLSAKVRNILDDAASSYAACSAISYDMSGYTSRAEAQTMLDVNWARFKECTNLIKDKKMQDFMTGA